MNFRQWCYDKWLDHCDEVLSWTGARVKYLSAEYFKKYKWWLKREYRSYIKYTKQSKKQ